MIRIGIVGTGATVSIAHYHAQGYKKDSRCRISAVYDIRREAAEKWVADHSLDARVCESFEELLEMCDAVDICTPNFLHYVYAEQALKAGKHLLVEKPMAVRLEECEMLAETAKATDRAAMVGMVYRYANPIRLAKKIVREKIGQVYTFSAWFGGKRLADPGNPMEWRMRREYSGSGALGDFGSHLVDLALYVAEQRYDQVACQSGIFIPQRPGKDGIAEAVENDDAAVFVTSGRDGLGNFTVSRVGMDDVMLLITGEGGMLQVSLRKPGTVLYWEKVRGGGYNGNTRQYEIEPQTFFDGWFDKEMATFLDAVEGDRSDIADIAQGLYTERVLFAAEKAAETGRAQKVRGE